MVRDSHFWTGLMKVKDVSLGLGRFKLGGGPTIVGEVTDNEQHTDGQQSPTAAFVAQPGDSIEKIFNG